MYSIHRKSNLATNLNKMRKIYPEYYNFYPETYVLPLQKKELFLEFGIDTFQSDKIDLNTKPIENKPNGNKKPSKKIIFLFNFWFINYF